MDVAAKRSIAHQVSLVLRPSWTCRVAGQRRSRWHFRGITVRDLMPPFSRTQVSSLTLSNIFPRQATGRASALYQGASEYANKRHRWPGHIAFAISGLSFLLPDVLMLRLCAVASCGFAIIFNYYHPVGQALWLPIGWNVFYVVVNVVWSGLLVKDRAISLHRWERRIYDEFFKKGDEYLIAPKDFRRFLHMSKSHGHVNTVEEPLLVVHKGEFANSLVMLISGEAEIDIGGMVIIQRRRGFFGLVSFVNKQLATATVTLRPGCTYLVWNCDDVTRVLKSDSTLGRGFGRLMACEIAEVMAHIVRDRDEAMNKRTKVQGRDHLVPMLNRRRAFDPDLAPTEFSCIMTGRLWKLNENGNIEDAKHWKRRDFWMARNGCFMYWSAPEKEDLVHWIPPDLVTAVIEKAPCAHAGHDYVFLVWPNRAASAYLKPVAFAAESEEDRDRWVAALVASGREYEDRVRTKGIPRKGTASDAGAPRSD